MTAYKEKGNLNLCNLPNSHYFITVVYTLYEAGAKVIISLVSSKNRNLFSNSLEMFEMQVLCHCTPSKASRKECFNVLPNSDSPKHFLCCKISNFTLSSASHRLCVSVFFSDFLYTSTCCWIWGTLI